MSTRVVLLRIGIDAGCGGIQGPLFGDGTFELICIPDRKRVSAHTYGNTLGRSGRSLVEFFPKGRRQRVAQEHIHLDPEFETFTYGDPTPPKRSLRKLSSGDVLAFYCGLQEWNSTGGWRSDRRPGLYLIGVFQVELAGMASEFDRRILETHFSNNFHVRYPTVFEQQKQDLVLVKGSSGSRLFQTAHRISAEGADRSGTPLKVLSPEMQTIFGTFGGRVSIQRSPPRWVELEFTDSAIEYLSSLA